jgi:CheY-like chemotaxis protein
LPESHLQKSIEDGVEPLAASAGLEAYDESAVAPSSLSMESEDGAAQYVGSVANRKALVVDDDPRNLYAMRILLERYQMEVLQAKNGREALNLIKQHPSLAVVLMDIMMPEMDGFETIKRIRTELNRLELPVIAVTAKAFPEDRERCIQAGASDYLAKPIDERQLIMLIGASLGN